MRRYLFGLFFVFSTLYATDTGFPKAYYDIYDSKLKKTAFVETLLPKIKRAEQKILSDRAFIKEFFHQLLFTYSIKSRYDMERFIKISKKYRIKQMYNEHEYLQKIDAIPVALVLAQSAVESAWGESRFVKEGNNLFGEWTWGKRGIIPEGRDENATHKIRIFRSLDDSIARYMLNLNRHYSYKEFRELREKKRTQSRRITGLEAAMTMTNYSQMREEYNRLLVKVIKGNGFMKYEHSSSHMLSAYRSF